jgi:hypothetical protein
LAHPAVPRGARLPAHFTRRNDVSEINDLVERYVAVWNEADPERRRQGIADLWAADGIHVNQSLVAGGYGDIEKVVTGAYEEFVAKGFVFRSADNADAHHNVVRFNWEMVPAGADKVVAVGFDFLILNDDKSIKADYQFIDQAPS